MVTPSINRQNIQEFRILPTEFIDVICFSEQRIFPYIRVQGGSNMTGTDLCVNKPHCAAAVRP